jgi:Leucine-rich repeat (LRR) protein
LTGDFPALGEMQDLQYIYLRHNTLSANLDFLKSGNLTKLASLWLDGNDISQTIPTEIGLITSLTSISIANASLTGTIPTEFGLLTNLQRLWLLNNQLTGKIPSQLEQLVNLEVLKVEDNSIKGHMPSGLCTIIEQSISQDKELSADCEHVKCGCCSPCTWARLSNETRA